MFRLTSTGSVRFSVPRPRVDQPRARPAGLLEPLGDADLRVEAAAALEDAQDVARLADSKRGSGSR